MKVDPLPFLRRHFPPSRIFSPVHAVGDGQVRNCFGPGNKVEHRLMHKLGLAAPVPGGEREQVALNFVPFAGTGRKMTD